MGKVIKCDFRRTARQKKKNRILKDVNYIIEKERQKNPNITGQELFSLPRVKELNKIYTKLITEERE